MATTTKRHFTMFKEEVWYWLKYFHLGDWEVDITMEPPDDCEDGSCGCDYAQKYARIRLSDNVNYDNETLAGKDEYIRKVAFHEVCELLLGEIRQVMIHRFATPEMCENSIHGVIARLTNSVYKEARNGY